jgi:hypothetical protein
VADPLIEALFTRQKRVSLPSWLGMDHVTYHAMQQPSYLYLSACAYHERVKSSHKEVVASFL